MNFSCHNLVTEKTKLCQLTIPSPAIVNLCQINVCQMFIILGKVCQLTNFNELISLIGVPFVENLRRSKPGSDLNMIKNKKYTYFRA